ncbi:MAG: N-acetylmuramate alpha-1-phosphate uridylyltransferase MurU [Pseudomonadota bacterium]
MILAAGLGTRLAPLTDHRPKPLLEVGGAPLIDHHLTRLAAAGFKDVVVNTSHLASLIEEHLGNGQRWGLQIIISREPSPPLDTGGGIKHALTLLGDAPFLVINGDVYTDMPLIPRDLGDDLAHLFLVDNPGHNSAGDFVLVRDRVLNPTKNSEEKTLTFSGTGIYDPRLFRHHDASRFPLAPLLRESCERNLVSGEHYGGRWVDVGTVQRLEAARLLALGN